MTTAWGMAPRAPDGHSFLAEQEVHEPAAPGVRTRPPAVRQEGRVRTARLLQRVGEDGQVREGAVVVDGLRQLEHGRRHPFGPGGDLPGPEAAGAFLPGERLPRGAFPQLP